MFRPRLVSKAKEQELADAMAWLSFVGLRNSANKMARDLSFGDQGSSRSHVRSLPGLMCCCSTSLRPEWTLWVDRMIEVIKTLPSLGKTVCIVEHNLQVVERLSDHVYFMELGSVTAEGTIAELMNDDHLTEVYFGTSASRH
jgi:branched-chain amino acid transport system permease protein